jgi:hypothetical protein
MIIYFLINKLVIFITNLCKLQTAIKNINYFSKMYLILYYYKDIILNIKKYYTV